jgi:hypothetical protein
MLSAIVRTLAAVLAVAFLVTSPGPARSGEAASCILPSGQTGTCASSDCTMCRDTSTGACYRAGVQVRCPFGVITVPPTDPPRTPRPSRRGEPCRLLGFGAQLGVCYNGDCTICRNPANNRCYRGGVTEVRCPRLLTEISPSSPDDPLK